MSKRLISFLIIGLVSGITSCSDDPQCPAQEVFETRLIRDVDYIQNKYFFLDYPATGVFFSPKADSLEVFESVEPFEIAADPTLAVWYGRAWVDTTGRGNGIREALARLEAGQPTFPFQEGQYRYLREGDDYRFVRDPNDNLVIGIELMSPSSDARTVAVRYVNTEGNTTGNYDNFNDTLALEIINPSNARPDDEFGYTWAYMMRHIYDLGLTDIRSDAFDLQIIDDISGGPVPVGASVPWIRVFGLDRTGEGGVGPPDGQVDLATGQIDFRRGLLSFPSLTPFAPSDEEVEIFTDDLFSFYDNPLYVNIREPEIYTGLLGNPQNYSHFTIRVEAATHD